MESNNSQMVVATLFQLKVREQGKFVEKGKEKVNTNVCKRQYVEGANAHSARSGKLYVIDEEATSGYYENLPKMLEQRKSKEAAESTTIKTLVDALNGAKDEKPKSTRSRAAKKESNENNTVKND